MVCMNERDMIRSEGEGFGLQELDSEHSLFVFLGRIQRKFKEDRTLMHLEDALTKVIEDIPKEERAKFETISKEHFGSEEECYHSGVEIKKNLSAHLKWFLGKAEWAKLEKLEERRIMEDEKHTGQGVG